METMTQRLNKLRNIKSNYEKRILEPRPYHLSGRGFSEYEDIKLNYMFCSYEIKNMEFLIKKMGFKL